MNDGTGVFADSGQSLGNRMTYSVTLGDLDQDGDLDVFMANTGQPDLVWEGTSLHSMGIEATDASKPEGNEGMTAFTFSVTRSGEIGNAKASLTEYTAYLVPVQLVASRKRAQAIESIHGPSQNLPVFTWVGN